MAFCRFCWRIFEPKAKQDFCSAACRNRYRREWRYGAPPEPRACRDCGAPTSDYRCQDCQQALKLRLDIPDDVDETEHTFVR